MTRSARFLLQGALAYGLDVIGTPPPTALGDPTPCPDWDLRALVGHLVDSLTVLADPVGTHRVTTQPVDPVGAFVEAACLLLTRPRAGHPAEDLPAPVGALEVAVHTWDVTWACQQPRPVPAIIATDLLELAPRIVPDQHRPGLFAAPVAVPARTPAGDRLVAFLGRHLR